MGSRNHHGRKCVAELHELVEPALDLHKLVRHLLIPDKATMLVAQNSLRYARKFLIAHSCPEIGARLHQRYEPSVCARCPLKTCAHPSAMTRPTALSAMRVSPAEEYTMSSTSRLRRGRYVSNCTRVRLRLGFLEFARMASTSVRAIGENGVQPTCPAPAVSRDVRARQTAGEMCPPARPRVPQHPHLVPVGTLRGAMGATLNDFRRAVRDPGEPIGTSGANPRIFPPPPGPAELPPAPSSESPPPHGATQGRDVVSGAPAEGLPTTEQAGRAAPSGQLRQPRTPQGRRRGACRLPQGARSTRA